MYVSTTSNATTVATLETLADSVVAAIEADIAHNSQTVFSIATAAGMLPQDLAAFLGPNSGSDTFPQHEQSITLAEAEQILSGISEGGVLSIDVTVATAGP